MCLLYAILSSAAVHMISFKLGGSECDRTKYYAPGDSDWELFLITAIKVMSFSEMLPSLYEPEASATLGKSAPQAMCFVGFISHRNEPLMRHLLPYMYYKPVTFN